VWNLVSHAVGKPKTEDLWEYVLRRIFGTNNEGRDVYGDRRKFHNAELQGLCSSPNIIRVIKGERGGRRNADRASMGALKGRWPLGRRRCRREDNTNPDFTKKWDKVYTRLVSSQRNNHSVSAQCAECPKLLGNSESGKDSAPRSYSVFRPPSPPSPSEHQSMISCISRDISRQLWCSERY